jgi:hypothetical protein
MKRIHFILGTLILLVASVTRAQNYSINWYKVAGGGGGSSGGAYSVTGTVGQPDAGGMANAPYTLEGGFWGILSMPRPQLRIWIQGSNVIVAWPVTVVACQLQETSGLTAPAWSNVSQMPAVVGTEYRVTLPLAGFQQYFRLIEL